MQALSDADAGVRAAAAVGLGEIGAKQAVERLFLALDRGNMEASGAIGKLLGASDAERLLSYLGKIPFRSLGPALGEMLQRSDVKEATKLRIVARLEEVGTPEVKGYFGDLVSSSSEALGPKVAKAVLRAMQEIAD
jgi:HEAT repeat protein